MMTVPVAVRNVYDAGGPGIIEYHSDFVNAEMVIFQGFSDFLIALTLSLWAKV